jgi:hypothetical protein
LVSNGKHIYDEQGNRLWNGMLFSSKKHFYLIIIIFIRILNLSGYLLIVLLLGQLTTKPGVDVMIIIFCDFRQFSAKKIGGFLKNQCSDQNFEQWF